MKKLRACGVVAVLGLVTATGVARAGGVPFEPWKPTVSFVPAGKAMISITGSLHFAGGLTYSEEGTGLSISDSTEVTESGKVALGYELYEGIELGVAVRRTPKIKFADATWDNRETDLFGRAAIHTRPWQRLDVSFSADFGYSTIHQSESAVPDATGFVMDLSGGAMYPIGANFYGLASFGYQRGFQTTTTEHIPGKPEVTNYTTDFLHADLGIGYRFF